MKFFPFLFAPFAAFCSKTIRNETEARKGSKGEFFILRGELLPHSGVEIPREKGPTRVSMPRSLRIECPGAHYHAMGQVWLPG